MLLWTNSRVPAEQTCPEFNMNARTVSVTAKSNLSRQNDVWPIYRRVSVSKG